MVVAFFINTVYLVFVARMRYASDLEWFRIRVLSAVMIAAQLIVGLISTF